MLSLIDILNVFRKIRQRFSIVNRIHYVCRTGDIWKWPSDTRQIYCPNKLKEPFKNRYEISSEREESFGSLFS